ncbi:MAG: ABC transporter ATP-binding protein [Pseudomonadota bacterium]
MPDDSISESAQALSPPQARETILTIAGLRKEFGDFTALDGIDLKVAEGEFLTVVGPSGSGKTTLIRILAGMEEPSDGAVLLRNERIEKVPANKRPTCMVFQSLALFPHRSVGENIAFPLKIRGIDGAARTKRALELLEMLRLPADYHDKRIHECSGGERQRIALARALAFDPEILFFDEPLSALDYRLRKTLEKELKDLHARTGKTFVYITHSLEEAMVMSDRIAIMRAGQFEQIGSPTDIYTRPRSRFVAEFMGEVNLFPLTQDGRAVLRLAPDAVAADASGLLMARPETLRFLSDGQTAPVEIDGVLSAEYNLGGRLQYLIDTAAGPVTVETLREQRTSAAIGGHVRLGARPGDCHIIEA